MIHLLQVTANNAEILISSSIFITDVCTQYTVIGVGVAHG